GRIAGKWRIREVVLEVEDNLVSVIVHASDRAEIGIGHDPAGSRPLQLSNVDESANPFRLGQGDIRSRIGSGETVIVDTKLRSLAGQRSSAESESHNQVQ